VRIFAFGSWDVASQRVLQLANARSVDSHSGKSVKRESAGPIANNAQLFGRLFRLRHGLQFNDRGFDEAAWTNVMVSDVSERSIFVTALCRVVGFKLLLKKHLS